MEKNVALPGDLLTSLSKRIGHIAVCTDAFAAMAEACAPAGEAGASLVLLLVHPLLLLALLLLSALRLLALLPLDLLPLPPLLQDTLLLALLNARLLNARLLALLLALLLAAATAAAILLRAEVAGMIGGKVSRPLGLCRSGSDERRDREKCNRQDCNTCQS